jgi:hypothetical protein
MEHSFHGRKSHATQNVMVVVDFDLGFIYILADWEGTTHDALVLRDALEHENGLCVPQGKILHQFVTKMCFMYHLVFMVLVINIEFMSSIRFCILVIQGIP